MSGEHDKSESAFMAIPSAISPSSDLSDAADLGATGDLVLDDPTMPMLIELMRDGRLRAPSQRTREILRERILKAEVLRTGHGWAIFRTLEPAGHPMSTREEAEERREIIMAGTLGPASIAVIDIIGFLSQGLQTGELSVSHENIERSVFFNSGEVVWASSTAPQDNFGEFLIRRGKITPHQLSQIVRETPDRIGRTCVDRGFVAAHDLWALVQAQLTEIFEKLLMSDKGMWTFARVPEEALGQSEVHMSTQGLLMDALKRLDEMRVYREVIRSSAAIVKRTQLAIDRAEDPSLLNRVDKDVREAAGSLLAHVRKIATIQDLIRASGKGEYEVTQLVFHLQKSKLLEVVSQERSSIAPVPKDALTPVLLKDIVSVYSIATSEIFRELSPENRQTARSAAEGFCADPNTPFATVLEHVNLKADGSLATEPLMKNLPGMNLTARFVSDSLSELLFFLLFEATEQMPPAKRDDLARRVKRIHGMLTLPGDESKPEAPAE